MQEMSDTIAALRAAKEVQADVLAPEIFREAREAFFKGKREYRLKNFALAKQLIDRSRTLAERAEFEALKSGATRSAAPPDPMAESQPPPASKPPEDEYQQKQGTYFESYQENRAKIENKELPPAPSTDMGIRPTQEPTSTSPQKPLVPVPVPGQETPPQPNTPPY